MTDKKNEVLGRAPKIPARQHAYGQVQPLPIPSEVVRFAERDADMKHPTAEQCAVLAKITADQQAAGSVEAEREAFEHAERESNLQRDEIGDYANPCVQSAWEGWQARAALATASAASAPDAQSERDALLDEVASIVTMYDKRATPQGIAAAIRSMKSVAAAHKAQRERGPT